MRPRAILPSVLLAGLLLSACALETPTSSKHATGLTGRSVSSPTPATSPDRPSPGPSAVGTAVPRSQPAGPTTLISGLMQIDASYVISAGGGNVISAGGGNVISAGGGNLITAGGGNLITAGGGNLITAGGGNLITAGGGNLVTAGGGNYLLLEASATSDTACTTQGAAPSPTASLDPLHVPADTILPAANMVVVPMSITTGKQLGPAVFTNGSGHYTVSVPQGDENDVVLLAAVPASSANSPLLSDPRLSYRVLPGLTSGSNPEIDEDTAIVSRYLISVMQKRLDQIISPSLLASSATDLNVDVPNIATPAQGIVDGLAATLRDDVKTAPYFTTNLALLTPRVKALAQYMANREVAKLEPTLSTITLSPLANVGPDAWQHPLHQQVVADLIDLLRQVRVAAGRKLQADPNYFYKASYVQAANATLPKGTPPYEIKKASDLCDFVVNYYFSVDHVTTNRQSELVFKDLGLVCDDAGAQQYFDALQACADSILVQLATNLITENESGAGLQPLIDQFTPPASGTAGVSGQ